MPIYFMWILWLVLCSVVGSGVGQLSVKLQLENKVNRVVDCCVKVHVDASACSRPFRGGKEGPSSESDGQPAKSRKEALMIITHTKISRQTN